MSEAAATPIEDMLTAIVATGGDPADLPFWEATREGRFLLHTCGKCGRQYWPASRCVEHGNEAMAWVEASGRGEVFTYTVMHHAYTPTMKGKVPYAVVVVKLEEGPFFHAGMVGCRPDAVHVGMKVASEMVPHESGLTLPQFRPV